MLSSLPTALPTVLPTAATGCGPPAIEEFDLPHFFASASAARRLRAMFTSGLISLGGCALQPVQAWEKSVLAKPEMTFEGDALDVKYVEHTYSSKEAASGGSGVGGGGCGCN